MNQALASAAPSRPVPPPLPEARWHERWRRRVSTTFDSIFGFFTLVAVLAVVSAVPLLNLFSLGYLLEASARVGRTGKFRSGFIGLPWFAAMGKAAFGIWIWTLPIRLLHSYWIDAELIDSGSERATSLKTGLIALTVIIGFHLAWALIRGGKLRHFFWPAPLRFVRWLSGNRKWAPVKERFRNGFRNFQPLHYLKLGALGFAGAAAWLAVPVAILMAASGAGNNGIALLGSLFGGILLGLVILYLPFLQTEFALTGRFRDFFSIQGIRKLFRKAPLAFWLALFVTLLFAVPLYLLKIELTPKEVAWLPNVVFVLFIFPARLLVGWAVSRAHRRDLPRIWVSRWISRLAAIPVVAAYVLIVWLTQYLSWHGTYSLLEQHAFMVPAPLLGL